jgi:hypothetical protein
MKSSKSQIIIHIKMVEPEPSTKERKKRILDINFKFVKVKKSRRCFENTEK